VLRGGKAPRFATEIKKWLKEHQKSVHSGMPLATKKPMEVFKDALSLKCAIMYDSFGGSHYLGWGKNGMERDYDD